MVEYPRWFNLVLRAVGLTGDGEIGVRGATGDLRAREGRVLDWTVVEMLRESLGLTTREASISAVGDFW